MKLNHVFRLKDWSLSELLGVCSLLNIPFVVIVQAHVLKDKGSVRLRRVLSDDLEIGWHTGSSGGSEVVRLENLASTIREMSAEASGVEERIAGESEQDPANQSCRDLNSVRMPAAQVECVYIDQENFYSDDVKVSKNDKTAQWKGGMKALKSVSQRSESYLSSHLKTNSSGATPVFAVADVPFWVLRDFGTALMRRERKEQSAVGASVEASEAFPKGKRPLKTLASAIDIFMKKRGIWEDGSRVQSDASLGSKLLTILLYSKMDDRFDMISLEVATKARNGTPTRKR